MSRLEYPLKITNFTIVDIYGRVFSNIRHTEFEYKEKIIYKQISE